MIALVFLAGLAAALAEPFTILPIYENPLALQRTPMLEKWAACIDDCHHHMLNKPVYIMARAADDKFIVNYAPEGLNSLSKSPLTAPIHQTLMAGRKVGVIFPFDKFPTDLFPEVNSVSYIVPEHRALFSEAQKEAPIMVVFSEEEFSKLNLGKTYSMIAEMSVSPAGFGLVKDYALVNRAMISNVPAVKSPAISPLVYLVTPQAYPTSSAYSYITPDRAYVVPQTHLPSDIPAFIPKHNAQAHWISL